MAAHDIKPITYLKNATARLVREVAEGGRTVTITQNGEAKVVLMGVRDYDRWQQAVALLKLLSLSTAESGAGRVMSHADAMARLDAIVDAPGKRRDADGAA